MSLRKRQSIFASKVPGLINKAIELGFEVTLGDAYRDVKKDRGTAVDYYNKAVKLDTENYYIYIQRGLAYQFSKNYDLALRDFNKATKLKPLESYPFIQRSVIYLERKDYERALRELSSLREPVDAFFDSVMVMVDDEAIKNNRIALLAQMSALFMRAADLSRLHQKG